ncbi:hypothetical protein M1L60_32185 [Actinoplanes sp. TRM 88003]|uniref:Uncharacterized protein n=1 Tax=Paractinoplanes aksuensis TaxID=2939490 RepID=A0ABT1DWJ5_9ACTN|nr:hypothetical protein [Actinoplanes aksuensis]MCO8275251.1 hypothetical protein [Actinoplanes aksuensis]
MRDRAVFEWSTDTLRLKRALRGWLGAGLAALLPSTGASAAGRGKSVRAGARRGT